MATVDIALVTSGRGNIDEAEVHGQLTLPAAAAIDALQPVVIDVNGKWALADADVQATRDLIYIAMRKVAAGEALTAGKSLVAGGLDLSAMAFGDPIYLSNTAGAFSSGVPGTGTTVICGRVVPVFANGATPDRLAKFCTY